MNRKQTNPNILSHQKLYQKKNAVDESSVDKQSGSHQLFHEPSQQPSSSTLLSNEETPLSPSVKSSVCLSPETMIVPSQKPIAIESPQVREIILVNFDEVV